MKPVWLIISELARFEHIKLLSLFLANGNFKLELFKKKNDTKSENPFRDIENRI